MFQAARISGAEPVPGPRSGVYWGPQISGGSHWFREVHMLDAAFILIPGAIT